MSAFLSSIFGEEDEVNDDDEDEEEDEYKFDINDPGPLLLLTDTMANDIRIVLTTKAEKSNQLLPLLG